MAPLTEAVSPRIEIFDEYLWQKDRQVITRSVHQLPGLGNFTHWYLTRSLPPISMHYHSGIIEIHCMVKGKRVAILENNEQPRHYTVMGNELFMTFPYELHSIGRQTPCEFYALQLITKEHDHILGMDKTFSNALCEQLLALKHRHLTLSATALHLIRTSFNLFTSHNPHDFHTAVQFLSCFLHNLVYLPPIGDEIVRPIDASIQRTLDYIDTYVDRPLPLSELAGISGYSLSRFKAKFKEEVGITPTELISLQKIERAKVLLETTDTPVTDLAFNLGFSSSSYFCTVFKKFTGISPHQYKKAKNHAAGGSF